MPVPRGTSHPAVPRPAAEALSAKLVALEMAVRVTDGPLHVHGGHSYASELAIELYYRNARSVTFHFIIAVTLQMKIAQILLAARCLRGSLTLSAY